MRSKRLASFHVDAQKGFTPLCPEELPVPEGDEIVGALKEQDEYCIIRIGSKDWHPENAMWIANPEHPQFEKMDNEGMDMRWNKHCIAGTRGAELLDGLPHPKEYDFFVWKGMEPDMHPYSACYHDLKKSMSTGVIEFLRIERVRSIVIGGLALDYCVKETALDLMRVGHIVYINLPSTRSIGDADSVKKMTEELMKLGINFIIPSSLPDWGFSKL